MKKTPAGKYPVFKPAGSPVFQTGAHKGLLDSALNRPLHLFHYGEPSLFDLATAYAEGIVKNHPFLDGNKRSGLMAAALFLESNGYVFQAPEEEAVLQTLALAADAIGAAEFSAWLSKSCVPPA